jgi:hypothetical protein
MRTIVRFDTRRLVGPCSRLVTSRSSPAKSPTAELGGGPPIKLVAQGLRSPAGTGTIGETIGVGGIPHALVARGARTGS